MFLSDLMNIIKGLFDDHQFIKTDGCYFCSNPDTVKRVQCRIGTDVVKVKSCQICADVLKDKKSVHILHFQINGEAIHWSDYEHFEPDSIYWNLNRPKLRVIK